jgi:electron transport complex protein RnfC
LALLKQLVRLKGGVYPPYQKHLTDDKPVEKCDIPNTVIIPMQQHIGVPCKPLIKAGDHVKLGQKIGQPAGFVSSPVHSSVSGTVKEIGNFPHPSLGESLAALIENDFSDALDDGISPKNLDELSAEDVKGLILEAGIVGMGGAAFPTHVKLSPTKGKVIDTFIINGTECEPYLTADHRLMLEEADKIVLGMRAMMKALGVTKGIVAIEDNKSDAVESMLKATAKISGIDVAALKTKYSQGAEKQVIKSVLGREVRSGGLPMDVGVVVNNVATAAAVANAIITGMPLIERRLTVAGSAISQPKNLLVRIGTQFEEVIKYCGGINGNIDKIISGGPMMGAAQFTLKAPVIKNTTGLLVFKKGENTYPAELPCIRCANCMKVCPAFLMPMMIHAYSFKGNYEAAQKYKAMDCIECGCCSYGCPSKIPLLQSIIAAKNRINAKKQNRG